MTEMRAQGPSLAKATAIKAPAGSLRSQGLDRLLKVEADARKAESTEELAFLIANETPKLTQAAQIFVLKGHGQRFKVNAVSAIGKVDRDAPRIRWVENLVRNLAADAGLAAVREFTLPAYGNPDDPETSAFPFRFLLWAPLKLRSGHVFGGMLLARERLWTQADIVIATRLAETYGHAWAALVGKRRLKRRPIVRPLLTAFLLALVAAGFYPVPLTVIAPVEVRSIEGRVIAAPLDGVIDSIEVDPSDSVSTGDVLVRMSDTTLRNDLAVAEQDLRVAEARLKQVTQSAVTDPQARGELAIARTETALAMAKRSYAEDLLKRSVVASPADGVAIFSDKQDWIGRPVSTGERLMEIADPSQVQLRIDVPVADVLAVQPGAEVRAFLDSDPLHPLAASVSTVSFEARPIEGDRLAYRIYARLEDKTQRPKLGVRGTAQLFGDKVPLAYYLFRRPISAMRQRFGL